MGQILKTAALAASISIAAAFAANADRTDTDGPLMCEGQMFAGDYLATPNTDTPITADLLNIALGESLVSEVSGNEYFLQITPVDLTMDCDDFMQDLMSTGLFKNVSPNAILGIGGPGPDFY